MTFEGLGLLILLALRVGMSVAIVLSGHLRVRGNQERVHSGGVLFAACNLGVNHIVIVPTEALVVPSSAVCLIRAAAEWRGRPLDVGHQAISYPNMVDY